MSNVCPAVPSRVRLKNTEDRQILRVRLTEPERFVLRWICRNGYEVAHPKVAASLRRKGLVEPGKSRRLHLRNLTDAGRKLVRDLYSTSLRLKIRYGSIAFGNSEARQILGIMPLHSTLRCQARAFVVDRTRCLPRPIPFVALCDTQVQSTLASFREGINGVTAADVDRAVSEFYAPRRIDRLVAEWHQGHLLAVDERGNLVHVPVDRALRGTFENCTVEEAIDDLVDCSPALTLYRTELRSSIRRLAAAHGSKSVARYMAIEEGEVDTTAIEDVLVDVERACSSGNVAAALAYLEAARGWIGPFAIEEALGMVDHATGWHEVTRDCPDGLPTIDALAPHLDGPHHGGIR